MCAGPSASPCARPNFFPLVENHRRRALVYWKTVLLYSIKKNRISANPTHTTRTLLFIFRWCTRWWPRRCGGGWRIVMVGCALGRVGVCRVVKKKITDLRESRQGRYVFKRCRRPIYKYLPTYNVRVTSYNQVPTTPGNNESLLVII